MLRPYGVPGYESRFTKSDFVLDILTFYTESEFHTPDSQKANL